MLVASANNTVVDNELSLNDQIGVAIGEELLPSNGNRVEHNTIDEGGGGFSIIDSTGNRDPRQRRPRRARPGRR